MKMKINKYRSNIAYISILIVMALLIFFQTYKKNNLEYKFSILNNRTKSLKNDLKVQSDLEGEFLWDVSNIKKESINKVLSSKNISSNYILFGVDSIICNSCFNFHIENLNQLAGIKIIVYSPSHPEYVQSFLNNGIIFKYVRNYNKNNNKMLSNNMVINFVDISGQIIYTDIADKYNYGKSRKFYKKVKQFITQYSKR